MNLIIRENPWEYEAVCKYLEEHDYKSLILNGFRSATRIRSKKDIVKESISCIKPVIRNRSNISSADVVVSIGNLTTMYLIVMNKLHVINRGIYSGGASFSIIRD